MCPTNAVSIKEAIGSAAKATAAGRAMESISIPSSSNLNQSFLFSVQSQIIKLECPNK
jgi:hypothetical protein